MNTSWSEFLQNRPAADNDPMVDCALNDLSHFGLIRVSGEDAESFLQGQLTNDMREVTASHSNLAGWCSAKGRMLANFRCFRRGDDLFLQTPTENMAVALKRLGMFVLMAKVSLADVSDELIRIGISGDCADQVLKNHLQTLPDEINGVVQQGNLTAIRLPGTTPRYQLIGDVQTLQEIWQTAEASARRMDQDYWAMLDIQAGLPNIYQATSEAFVPQMTNMQLVDGVSFTKGCYVGQEVVARMQYLGKLKRRMYLAHIDVETPPQPGDELFSSDSTSGQGAGKLVDARPSSKGGYDLLAVIEISSADGDEIHLGENGPKLTLKALPYPFAE